MKYHVVAWIVLSLVAAGSASIGAYFYFQYRRTQATLSDPAMIAREELTRIVKTVGGHMELPEEEPTLATVSNLDVLKDQPFFAKAKIGDKVLVYVQSGKAILYRPATKKVIEVMPIRLPTPGQEELLQQEQDESTPSSDMPKWPAP